MRIRGFIAPLFSIFALFALAGCGSSSDQPTSPPGGSFTNSNLNGTYVISFSGYDTSNGYGSYFSVLGSVTANGSGGFTNGIIDIDDPALGSALRTNYAFTHLSTTGTYNVTPDGRGTGNISVSINGTNVQFGLDFVLTSNSHGSISRFDNYGSGSGSIDLQSGNLAQSSLAGSYAFGFNGVDSTVINSLSTVGAFTLDGNGQVTAGQQDFGDNGNSRGLRNLPISGSVLVGVPGSSQLTTSAFGFGTLHFDVWAIDSTHLKFIETDSVGYMEGDAISSTGHTSFPSGPLVLALSGEDVSEGPFAAAGLLMSDGTGQITSGLEDNVVLRDVIHSSAHETTLNEKLVFLKIEVVPLKRRDLTDPKTEALGDLYHRSPRLLQCRYDEFELLHSERSRALPALAATFHANQSDRISLLGE